MRGAPLSGEERARYEAQVAALEQEVRELERAVAAAREGARGGRATSAAAPPAPR